jgi:hypothetical protein
MMRNNKIAKDDFFFCLNAPSTYIFMFYDFLSQQARDRNIFGEQNLNLQPSCSLSIHKGEFSFPK